MSSRIVEAVVIGGSTGAIEALLEALPRVPANLAIPIVTVVHVPADRPSLLSDVFAPHVRVPSREPLDKEPVQGGVLWWAPSDYHLLIEEDRTFAFSSEPPVGYARPSIDVLFESAAEVYGPSLLGVLLSGANMDGARGLAAIRAAGGMTVVQAPRTAVATVMPEAGIALARPRRVCTPRSLGTLLAAVARRTRGKKE